MRKEPGSGNRRIGHDGSVSGLDLEAFAGEHVTYEAGMLVGTFEPLKALPDSIARNAALESFLIHARAMDDFLSSDKARSDDVVAKHYMESWTSESVLPADARKAVNKLVAHLTSKRLDKQPVNIADVLDAVIGQFEKFLEELPPERRGWFGKVEGFLTRARNDDAMTFTTTSTTVVSILRPGTRLENPSAAGPDT